MSKVAGQTLMEDGDGHRQRTLNIGGLQWIQVDKGRQHWTEMERSKPRWIGLDGDGM